MLKVGFGSRKIAAEPVTPPVAFTYDRYGHLFPAPAGSVQRRRRGRKSKRRPPFARQPELTPPIPA